MLKVVSLDVDLSVDPGVSNQNRFLTQRSAGTAELRQKLTFFRIFFRKNILFEPMLRV